jgi:hypothetical protein
MANRKQRRKQMNITVKNRTRPSIIVTAIEIIAGIGVLAVIIVVLLTGIGAVLVHMSVGGLPQPVINWSLGLYHYFFGW